ncbi:MAG: transposase [Bacteroidetes bacterium]|nr:transposase [Bacteroidota bacterium]
MIQEFDRLLSLCDGAFKQARTAQKARQLAYRALTCLGRYTLTGMLTASVQQFVDWSSAYKLFGHARFDAGQLFGVARNEVLQQMAPDQMIVAHMDDTIIKKTGKKVSGSACRRDPLGPPFHTNFIWGQRFLQISMALPEKAGVCKSRAIPIDFHHCPTVKKPGKLSSEQDFLKKVQLVH